MAKNKNNKYVVSAERKAEIAALVGNGYKHGHAVAIETAIDLVADAYHSTSVFDRKEVVRKEVIDKANIYEKPIEEAAAFLKSLGKDKWLEEEWDGYDRLHINVCHRGVEDDDEYCWRISTILNHTAYDAYRDVACRDAEIKRLRHRLAELEAMDNGGIELLN